MSYEEKRARNVEPRCFARIEPFDVASDDLGSAHELSDCHALEEPLHVGERVQLLGADRNRSDRVGVHVPQGTVQSGGKFGAEGVTLGQRVTADVNAAEDDRVDDVECVDTFLLIVLREREKAEI